MNILEIRYNLATEMGLAISIISLVIALITILVTIEKRRHVCLQL